MGLKNFIYGLSSILCGVIITYLEYFVFAPLNDYEVALFMPLAAYSALFAVYFIMKGICVFEGNENELLTRRIPKRIILLIIAAIIVPIVEAIAGLLKTGSLFHKLTNILGDLIYVLTFTCCFIYLIDLRDPYKGGLFYKVITSYIITLALFLVGAIIMIQLSSPIELQQVEKIHDLHVWRLILLNMVGIMLIISFILAYRTINLFRKYLAY